MWYGDAVIRQGWKSFEVGETRLGWVRCGNRNWFFGKRKRLALCLQPAEKQATTTLQPKAANLANKKQYAWYGGKQREKCVDANDPTMRSCDDMFGGRENDDEDGGSSVKLLPSRPEEKEAPRYKSAMAKEEKSWRRPRNEVNEVQNRKLRTHPLYCWGNGPPLQPMIRCWLEAWDRQQPRCARDYLSTRRAVV